MIENDISTILLCLLLTVSAVIGALNLIHYKDFRRLKIENELLKFKLRKCEQSGSQRIHEEC